MNDTPSDMPLPEPSALALRFHGSPKEYFRIWIVNLCLTLVTFGIFSAWAKVRKKRYFYSHTTLDETPFQYLAEPLPILKGRVIAAVLFGAYYASSHFFTAYLPYVFMASSVVAPWVIARSAAFNARYSAFRNMTFHFDGTYRDALRALPVLALIPFLALWMLFGITGKPAMIAGVALFIASIPFPWWIRRFKQFLIAHTSFGHRNGSFSATGGQFFGVYFRSGLILIGTMIIVGASSFAAMSAVKASPQKVSVVMAVFVYAGYALAYAFLQALSGNLVWNHTALGPLRFRSTLTGWGMTKLYVTNALGILCSLGLLIPWAVIRTVRYRIDHLEVLQDGDLAVFAGSDLTAVAAAGAETIDFFDMDLSL